MTRWKDCELEVKADVVPRYFWTTVSIDVYLDGVCILRTGGVFNIKGAQIKQFKRNDDNHILELSWRSPRRGISFPYQVSIDGQPVIAATVSPKNWLLLLIPVAAVALPMLWIAIHFS